MSHKSAKRKRRFEFKASMHKAEDGVTMDKLRQIFDYIEAANKERFGAASYSLRCGPTYTATAKALGYPSGQAFMEDFIRKNDAGKTL